MFRNIFLQLKYTMPDLSVVTTPQLSSKITCQFPIMAMEDVSLEDPSNSPETDLKVTNGATLTNS